MLWRVMTDTAAGVNAHAWRAPSALADQVGTAARQWDSAGGTRRLWDKDASLWTGADEAKWLGWLAAVDAGRALLPKLHDMAAGIRRDGFTHLRVIQGNGTNTDATALLIGVSERNLSLSKDRGDGARDEFRGGRNIQRDSGVRQGRCGFRCGCGLTGCLRH